MLLECGTQFFSPKTEICLFTSRSSIAVSLKTKTYVYNLSKITCRKKLLSYVYGQKFLIYLPTTRVFPVKIQAVEIVRYYKVNYIVYEPFSCSWIINQSTILVVGRIIPTSKSNHYLYTELPQGSNSLKKL